MHLFVGLKIQLQGRLKINCSKLFHFLLIYKGIVIIPFHLI